MFCLPRGSKADGVEMKGTRLLKYDHGYFASLIFC